MTSLLARFAGNTFWMARYMERAENLARVLDVNETFARDSVGAEDWVPIVRMNADEERFFAHYPDATAEAVVSFYVYDRDNPASIRAAVRMARENARGIRHLISTEMWVHLNIFYERLRTLERDELRLSNLPRLCDTIKENCQEHTGITEGTFYRDQAWHFYNIGKYIERADQTSRLLDIKHHVLRVSDEDVQPFLDVSQWNALLRSLAGYHAFRRVHPRGIRASDVVAFLLVNEDFPRSIAACVSGIEDLYWELSSDHGLPAAPMANVALDELRTTLNGYPDDDDWLRDLPDFVIGFQTKLASFTTALGRAYFGY